MQIQRLTLSAFILYTICFQNLYHRQNLQGITAVILNLGFQKIYYNDITKFSRMFLTIFSLFSKNDITAFTGCILY